PDIHRALDQRDLVSVARKQICGGGTRNAEPDHPDAKSTRHERPRRKVKRNRLRYSHLSSRAARKPLMPPFRFAFALALLAAPVAVFALDPSAATPPVAKKVPHKLEQHGDTRIDDYFWIKDKTNKDVLAYLEAENAYTTTLLKPTEPFQAKLYKEFL